MIREWSSLDFRLDAQENELLAPFHAFGGFSTARVAVEFDGTWGGALIVACEYRLAPGGDWRTLYTSFTAEGISTAIDIEAMWEARLRVSTPHATALSTGRVFITAYRPE